MYEDENIETTESTYEVTDIVTEPEETAEPEPEPEPAPMSEFWIDHSDNIIHELFSSIGVDLDYVPQTKYECFSMALQFLAAACFLCWFLKYLFASARSFFRSRW